MVISEGVGDYSDLVREKGIGVVVGEGNLENSENPVINLKLNDGSRSSCSAIAESDLDLKKGFSDWVESQLVLSAT